MSFEVCNENVIPCRRPICIATAFPNHDVANMSSTDVSGHDHDTRHSRVVATATKKFWARNAYEARKPLTRAYTCEILEKRRRRQVLMALYPDVDVRREYVCRMLNQQNV